MTWEEVKKEAYEKNSKIKEIYHNSLKKHRGNEIHVTVIFENDEQVDTVVYYEEITKGIVLFHPKWIDFLSKKQKCILMKENLSVLLFLKLFKR